MKHLWQGAWIDDAQVAERLTRLPALTADALAARPPSTTVLAAAAGLAEEILQQRGVFAALHTSLTASGVTAAEADTTLHELGTFLKRSELERKITAELGRRDPDVLLRQDFRSDAFEGWAPLGVLIHVTPTNAPGVGALSAIEGLLAGNLNIVKLGSADNDLAPLFLEALGRHDSTGRLAQQLIVLRFSSKRREWLDALFAQADGIAVWGGEEAVDSVRALAPAGARVIEWGPKISFAYVTSGHFADVAMHWSLAGEICRLEQQACSSPQVVYLDTDDRRLLGRFAEALAATLREVSPRHPPALPSLQESAEVNNTVMVTRLERHLGLTEVLTADDGTWRVLVDHRSALRASPLYRTIWVKPLPRSRIVSTLRPMRRYLQTAGLACPTADIHTLSSALFDAGVLRIRPLGGMLDSYNGEPHDGVYALQRYSRRVSLQLGAPLQGIAALDELAVTPPPRPPIVASVMSKRDFQSQRVDDADIDLFFHSGGSSGAPKLSFFSYEDYDYQMQLAARGLLAAGLDPKRDRCMNLFFGGALYGGFISFFSILERMRAVQLPMAAHTDFALVARTIVEQRVDTLLGMPTYLSQLFAAESERLRAYAGVRQVFYGGEHFNVKQRQLLHERFGVQVIRSATYGSVDAGPLGFQCAHCRGSEHHLHTGLQTLEILDLDDDTPAAPAAIGRLVFTSHARRGQQLTRYDIGDVGRWIYEPCACGRAAPRFELLGRHGDVFRIATFFLNYRKLATIAAEHVGYAGEMQLRLRARGDHEELCVLLDAAHPIDEAALREALLEHDEALHEAVHDCGLTVRIERVDTNAMQRVAGSGKLRSVVDERV